MNPEAGPPHAGMIVKVSRLREFLCKEIHDRDPGRPSIRATALS